MKIAFITDTHAGGRNDSDLIRRYQNAFYRDVFFPELDARGIDTVFHLGDFFDRRKYINYNTLDNIQESFFEPLKERNIEAHIIVGNHDIFFRSTNRVNSPELLLDGYENVHCYREPDVVVRDGISFAFIPWINRENYDAIMKFVSNLEDDTIICGHFEFTGFMMHAGGDAIENGMDPKLFSRFPALYSGHFHTPSEKGNVKYLGSPFELTWNDYNDSRGFYIFDTEKCELEFVKNPLVMYHKLTYDDKEPGRTSTPTDSLKDGVVKVLVDSKENAYDLDKYLESVYAKEPNEVQVIERFSYFGEDQELTQEEIEKRAKDTPKLIEDYVRSVEMQQDSRTRLESVMKQLYAEALDEEV